MSKLVVSVAGRHNKRATNLCAIPKGALLVGSPQQVIDKILYEHELFGNTKVYGQFSVGILPHGQMMHAIELFGNVVYWTVRKALPNN